MHAQKPATTTPPSRPIPHSPLRTPGWILLVSCLAAVGALWCLLTLYGPQERSQALGMWHARLEQTALDRRDNLERAINSLYADAQTVAEYPTVRLLTKRESPRSHTGNDDAIDHLTDLLRSAASARAITNIWVVGASGDMVTCAFASCLHDAEIAKSLSAETALTGERAFRHEPFSTDSAWTFFAVPVRASRTQQITGAVVIVANGTSKLLPIATAKLSGTRTGEALLLEGGVNAATATSLQAARLRRKASKEPVLTVALPLNNAPWVVVARVARAEVMEGSRREIVAIAAAVIALLIAMAGTVWGFTARLRAERKLASERAAAQSRQAEEQIRRSYSLLRAISEGTTDAIFVKDKEGRYIFINSAGARSLGLAPDQVIGRVDVEIADTATAELWQSFDAEALRTRAPVSTKHTTSVNSRMATIQATVWPTFDGTGTPSGVVGIARDISELVEAEQRFRSLFEKAAVGIAICTPDGNFIDVNPFLAGMLGYAPDELRGRPVTNVLPAEDHDLHRALLRDGVSGRSEIFLRKKRYVRKDGSIVYGRLTGTLVRAPDGEPDHFLAIIEDISEEHQAQQALQQAEERYAALDARARALLEANVVGVAVGNADGGISHANDYFLDLIGYSREDLAAGSVILTDLTPPEFIALDMKAMQELRERGVTTPYEKQYVRKDGKRTWVLIGEAILPGPDEEILAFIVDINAQKDLELQYLHAQKLEAVGRLAGGVAHDFNNILTAIKGIASLGVEEVKPSDPIYADLVEINACADRATALTRQLLAFSRRQVLQPKVFDVRELLTGMSRLLGRLIGEDVDLRVECSDEPLTVNADPSQIEQVILNLALNARDAMPEGGFLGIRASLEDALAGACDRAAGPLTARHVVLSVSDSGMGMDEATRQRAFEPFFTTKEPGKGTGLGLATVYGIVKQSGGCIGVHSVPGSGTTFTIHLPHANATVAQAKCENSRPVKSRRSVVLVVEDEDAVRMLVKRAIQRKGHRVLEARNAGEAMMVAERCEEPLDLIITDLVMPGMSGHELVSRLRQTRPLKALFMSGYSADMVASLKDVEGTFLEKPFTPHQLWQTMASTLAAD